MSFSFHKCPYTIKLFSCSEHLWCIYFSTIYRTISSNINSFYILYYFLTAAHLLKFPVYLLEYTDNFNLFFFNVKGCWPITNCHKFKSTMCCSRKVESIQYVLFFHFSDRLYLVLLALSQSRK